jgi:signal transduction histidine kinase
LNKEEKINWGVFIWVSSYKNDDPIILGIKYADKKRFLREKQEEKYLFENYLLPNFVIFIQNALLRLQTQRTTSILTENRERLSHEIGQVAIALRGLDYLYNKKLKKYENSFSQGMTVHNIDLIHKANDIFITKANFYRKDVLRLFESIEMLIKIFSTDYKPIPKYFDLWKDFLNMWNLSFNVATKIEKKYIDLPFRKAGNLETHNIFTDPNLLQFILYNIINNAIKYSLVNTIITVKYEKKEPKEHIFTVSNFGAYLDPKDISIYENGIRHPEMKGMISAKKDYVAPGEGIGLFWCKMLVNKLGGEIIHSCNDIDKPVCKYNIPLMKPFFKLYENYAIFKELWDKKKELGLIRSDIPEPSYYEIREEYEKLIRSSGDTSKYNRIVKPWKNDKLNNITFTQMSTDISIPTYEVVFTIKIPNLEESNEN